MRLKPDTIALTVLLALLTALGPLATDMYLPALTQIQADLGGSLSSVQMTLSLFLIGFAGGQLFYGPISDRFGRRIVLLFSLAFVMAADLACTVAPNMATLIFARLAVGLGTAGPIVLARSIVRDLYSGPRAGQELSRMGSIMGLVPAVGPVLGALVHETAGWRMIFAVQFLLATMTALAVLLALPETIGNRRRREPLSLAAIPAMYLGIARHPVFALYSAAAIAVFGGFFAFIASVAFILQDVYGEPPVQIGVAFGLVALAFVSGTLVGGRLVMRSGIDRTMTWGSAFLVAGGVLMIVLVLDSYPHSWDVIAPMMIYGVGLGIAFPQGIAGAIMPFPDRAGAASSLFGFLQMTVGALIATFLAATFRGTTVPFAMTVLVLGAAALAINLWLRIARPAGSS